MGYGQGYAQTGQSGSLGQASSMQPSAPTPISPMQEARQHLSASVGSLHDRLSALERRLDSVCQMAVPDATNQSTGANTPPSELRAFLSEQTSGVMSAVIRLESLLNRLEL